MELTVAENQFAVSASQERVWDLLGRVIFSSMSGLEKMKIVDENTFRAELKTKAFGVPMTMYLKGEVVDMSPPDSISVLLNANSKWNLVSVLQKVTILSKPAGNGKTEITCRAQVKKMTPVIKVILLGQVKKQAKEILNAMEARLKQIA